MTQNYNNYKNHQNPNNKNPMQTIALIILATIAIFGYQIRGVIKPHFNTADKNIENVDGWCANHHCVSAVSLYFLAISDKFHTIKNKLLENFKQLNLENISAYWWSDNIYTLYYLFLSYQKLNLKLNLHTS